MHFCSPKNGGTKTALVISVIRFSWKTTDGFIDWWIRFIMWKNDIMEHRDGTHESRSRNSCCSGCQIGNFPLELLKIFGMESSPLITWGRNHPILTTVIFSFGLELNHQLETNKKNNFFFHPDHRPSRYLHVPATFRLSEASSCLSGKFTMNVESSLVHCLFTFLNMLNTYIYRFWMLLHTYMLYMYLCLIFIYTSMPILRSVSSCINIYIYI